MVRGRRGKVTRRRWRMMMVERRSSFVMGGHWMVVVRRQVRGASIMGRGAAVSWRTGRMSGPMSRRPSPMARRAVGGWAAMCWRSV